MTGRSTNHTNLYDHYKKTINLEPRLTQGNVNRVKGPYSKTISKEKVVSNRSRSLDRQDRSRRRDRSMSNSRSRSGSRAGTNRDRIRCFECREYDHFARECPTR